jgi:hypothetical protein
MASALVAASTQRIGPPQRLQCWASARNKCPMSQPKRARPKFLRVGVRRVHGQGLLITRGGQRREEAGLWLGGWGDFVAQRMMAREDTEAPQKVQAPRWHCGAKPNDQVMGFEHDGAVTIFPQLFSSSLRRPSARRDRRE